MRTISDDTILLLLDGIERGLSRSDLADFAGVCEATAARYRRIYEENVGELPQLCGCGRPLKHQGQCRYRRDFAEKP